MEYHISPNFHCKSVRSCKIKTRAACQKSQKKERERERKSERDRERQREKREPLADPLIWWLIR